VVTIKNVIKGILFVVKQATVISMSIFFLSWLFFFLQGESVILKEPNMLIVQVELFLVGFIMIFTMIETCVYVVKEWKEVSERKTLPKKWKDKK